MSTFAYHNLIRACLLFNELSHSSAEAFRLSVKTAYRTLNSHLNAELDTLIDEFAFTNVASDFLVAPTQISNLCLQPELTLSIKRNTPLWFCPAKDEPRRFHLLFYRFVEHLSMPPIEYDLFCSKHPDRAFLVDLAKQVGHTENDLLLRVLVEHDAMLKQTRKSAKTKFVDEQLFFEVNDGLFWPAMKEYFLTTLTS